VKGLAFVSGTDPWKKLQKWEAMLNAAPLMFSITPLDLKLGGAR
jgi:hypothetical protein